MDVCGKNFWRLISKQSIELSMIYLLVLHGLLLNLFAFVQVASIPFVDSINFTGMMELRRENDVHSDPITIPRGFLFGRKRVTSAYVSALIWLFVCHCLPHLSEMFLFEEKGQASN